MTEHFSFCFYNVWNSAWILSEIQIVILKFRYWNTIFGKFSVDNFRKTTNFFKKIAKILSFCPWNSKKLIVFCLFVHEWKTTILLVHCPSSLRQKTHGHVFLYMSRKSDLWTSIPTVCRILLVVFRFCSWICGWCCRSKKLRTAFRRRLWRLIGGKCGE